MVFCLPIDNVGYLMEVISVLSNRLADASIAFISTCSDIIEVAFDSSLRFVSYKSSWVCDFDFFVFFFKLYLGDREESC